MTNLAILVGNTHYECLHTLECCEDDVSAVRDLLACTQKFQSVNIVLNKNASELKDFVRKTIDESGPLDEIFFYYTGAWIPKGWGILSVCNEF